MLRAANLPLIALGLSFLVLVPAPFFIGSGNLRVLTDLFLLMAAAQLWNLLAGYGGVVSIGQHAFAGAGAYAFFGLAVLLGLQPWLAMLLTLPFGVLLSLPVFALVMRLRTAYFAIGSWVVAETLSLMAGKLTGFGGGSGLSFPPVVIRSFGDSSVLRTQNVYWLALAVLLIIIALIIAVLHSRHGLALTAMRDNETAAISQGINPKRVKLILFMLSGGFLALIGAINTLQKLRISPAASFSMLDWTVYVIFICVIGGMGRLAGPILGALVFVGLRQALAGFGPAYMIVLGLIAIAVMLFEPRGLIVAAERLWKALTSRSLSPKQPDIVK